MEASRGSVGGRQTHQKRKPFFKFYFDHCQQIREDLVPMPLSLCSPRTKQLDLNLKGVVSKETVVLRRWESSIQKFRLSTELIM